MLCYARVCMCGVWEHSVESLLSFHLYVGSRDQALFSGLCGKIRGLVPPLRQLMVWSPCFHFILDIAFLKTITWPWHGVLFFGGFDIFLKSFNSLLLKSSFLKCLAHFFFFSNVASEGVKPCGWQSHSLAQTLAGFIWATPRVSLGLHCMCFLLTIVIDRHSAVCDGQDRLTSLGDVSISLLASSPY